MKTHCSTSTFAAVRTSRLGRRWAACAAALAGLTALWPVAAAPNCQAPTRIVERFIPADCESCWSQADPALPASAWALDWMVPAGPEAAMSAAALIESSWRLETLGMAAQDAATRRVDTPLPASPVRLRVLGGPAWNGYIGLELKSQGKPPAGATAYVALVEVLPAGQEGSAIERQLVRAVAGPMVLDAQGAADSQVRALRVPEGAKPERLQGVAWWVDRRGRLRGLAREGCPAR